MLSLVLKGKLAISEDVLTAVVFDALRDAHDVGAIQGLLAGARGLHGTASVPQFDGIEIELWPRTDAGEPDVRITLQAAGAHVGTVLVEAKLGAAKSGEGVTEADEEGTRRLRDQLARYLHDEAKRDPRCVLVYLTHHAVMPADDLAGSTSCLVQLGHGELAARLLWLPWREVERLVAHRLVAGAQYGRVRDVLRRAGMFWFDGIDVGARLELSGPPVFYRANLVTYPWPVVPAAPSTVWTYTRGSRGDRSAADAIDWPAPPTALGASTFYERGES